MMEPQGRGAWHAHLLYIWQDMKAPFIPNHEFADLWGHGFVSIKKLDDIDNVGAYLTAYLGDMELSEIDWTKWNEITRGTTVKQVEMLDDDGQKVTKQVLKGARLNLYPANFNMVRCSRGIKRPIEEMMSQEKQIKKSWGQPRLLQVLSNSLITKMSLNQSLSRNSITKFVVKSNKPFIHEKRSRVLRASALFFCCACTHFLSLLLTTDFLPLTY